MVVTLKDLSVVLTTLIDRRWFVLVPSRPVGRRPVHSPLTRISLLQRSIETLTTCQTLLNVPSIQCVDFAPGPSGGTIPIIPRQGGFTTENGRDTATRRRIHCRYSVINTGMAQHGAGSDHAKPGSTSRRTLERLAMNSMGTHQRLITRPVKWRPWTVIAPTTGTREM